MYQKTTWASGETITAAKLNNIEGGIASGGVLVVTDTDDVLDKTYAEITSAALSMLTIYDDGEPLIYTISSYGQSEEGCGVLFYSAMASSTKFYGCATPNDYPDANYSPK